MAHSSPPEMIRFNHTGFSQYLAERRLMAARCTHCGEMYLPPRPLCPRCYYADMEWVELPGEGRLEGFTFVHIGLPGMAAQGYSHQNPYCSGIVRLADGPTVAAQILTKETPPDAIRVGATLRAVFNDQGDSGEITLPFEPIL